MSLISFPTNLPHSHQHGLLAVHMRCNSNCQVCRVIQQGTTPLIAFPLTETL